MQFSEDTRAADSLDLWQGSFLPETTKHVVALVAILAQAGCSERPCVFAGCGAFSKRPCVGAFSDNGHATSLLAGASYGSGGAAAEHVDSICRVFPSVTVLRCSHSRRSFPCGERMVLEEWPTCHFRWTLLARRLLARLRRVTFARRFRPWISGKRASG